MNFGAFVRLSKTLAALVHISEFPGSYDATVEEPKAFMSQTLAIGQSARTRILSVDLDRRRVSLTLRDEHPWLDGIGLPQLGDAARGRVTVPSKQGAIVDLDNRLHGLSPREVLGSDTSVNENAPQGETPWPTGTPVVGRVVSLDHASRRVILHRRDGGRRTQ